MFIWINLFNIVIDTCYMIITIQMFMVAYSLSTLILQPIMVYYLSINQSDLVVAEFVQKVVNFPIKLILISDLDSLAFHDDYNEDDITDHEDVETMIALLLTTTPLLAIPNVLPYNDYYNYWHRSSNVGLRMLMTVIATHR